MPLRPLAREQVWLMPPSLDELVGPDHPARFVAALVDAMDRYEWAELGIGIDGEALGAPAYHPRGLLSVWLYGFMTRVRSSRKLEAACRDQMPYLWLTGWQHPDHNTLWRFYQAHRGRMRQLLRRTVRIAVEMGLLSMAIQAVDGTKVMANADKSRTYDAQGLKKLLEKTEAVIQELEAENEAGNDPPVQRLPQKLTQVQHLHSEVKAAMERLAAEEGRKYINLSDGDAEFVKARHSIVTGYNGQVVVSPVEKPQTVEGPDRNQGLCKRCPEPIQGKQTGLLITAADVAADPTDTAYLVPMLDQAEENTGKRTAVSLADAGYHSGGNVEACAVRQHIIVMPEAQQKALANPYHKDRFAYNQAADSYTCPRGQALSFRRQKHTKGTLVREYRASGEVCQACPAFGTCTSNKVWGRRIEIRPHDIALRRHREWMASEEARAVYQWRKGLVEPAIGILKEQMGLRQFLLRGLSNVKDEFIMLATAFNLRTLWGFCRAEQPKTGFSRVDKAMKGAVDRHCALVSQLRLALQGPVIAPAITRP